jgi:Ca2+:H+ antiporter
MPQADGKSGKSATQMGLAQAKTMKRKSKASRSWGDIAAGADPALVPVGSSDSLDQQLVSGKKKQVSQCQAIRAVCIEPISVLLLAWPFGVASAQLGWGPTWTFNLNFLALIPLAQILGNVTEELAAGLNNDTLGGLLNATFGNAVEMILTIQTLAANQLTVVKSTLLGSILSNLLLVLGCSLFAGGCLKKQMVFSKESASANVSLLLLSATSLALPACFADSEAVTAHMEAFPAKHDLSLQVSRYVSLVVLACYLAFLFFQFVTHADVFQDDEGEEEEGDEAQMKVPVALMMLAFTTALVAISSEFMVDSIEGIVTTWGIGKAFIGMILLPIVGNACEHFGAVKMAIQDKLDITIGIAVGSATQMALFVVPFAVLTGWLMNVEMDLNFGGLDTIIMCTSVVLAFSILQDGAGNWLEGFMLIAAYVIVATLYWFYPEEP